MIGAFILYLVKATVCLGVFSLFFRLLLMKETFFRFTRITLIVGLVICCVLPLVKIEIKQPNMIQRPLLRLEKMVVSYETSGGTALMNPDGIRETPEEVVLPLSPEEEVALMNQDEIMETSEETKLAMVPGEKPVMSEKKMFPFFVVVFAIYLLGLLIMCVRLIISLWRLRLIIRNNPVRKRDGYRLIICRDDIIPFSFFKYIVLSEADYRSNAREIILHEQMHIRYRHNLDILFLELLLMIHWFNPAVWSLYNDLREVHEYEADNAVIMQGIDPREYQLLLVKKAVGERRFTSVVNSFNQSKIKNRITMMLRKESSTWARLKVLLIVPLMAVLLLAFAQPERVEERIADHQSRKDAVDYFLSVRNGQKDNCLAYLYLNTKDQLYLMNKNAEAASLEVFHLKEKSDLAKTLTDLITEAIRKTTSTDIHFILGAENDTKMKDVSFVKNVIRDAHHKSCVRALKKSVLLEELKEAFPLLITYTSVQTSSPGGIVKQVQENPFFYWEEVQQFCKEKGITPEDMKIKPGTNQTKRLLVMLINSRNQVMFQSQVSSEWFKTPEEGNSTVSIGILKKMIVELMEKNDPDPVYFSFQHDVTTSTQFIFTFLESTLPAAYEAALNEISERDNITVEQLRKEKPLLLLHGIPKNYSRDVNPRTQQEKQRNKKFIINISMMEDGKEKKGLYTAVSYGEQADLQTVSLRYEIIPGKSGEDNIVQEQVSTISTLDSADMAVVSVGTGVAITDLNNIKTVLDKKLKLKKSIFVQRL